MRNLNLILGDQLDLESCCFDEFDPAEDSLWMAEVNGENTHVKHHKHQIVMFLAAMRHFAQTQRDAGRDVLYTELPSDGRKDRGRELGDVLAADLKEHAPKRIRVVRPGDKRVLKMLEETCAAGGQKLEVLEDTHFFTTPADFAEHAEGRKSLRLEYFYRELRQRFDLLMDDAGEPLGGDWNYDQDNRESFGKEGPPEDLPQPRTFAPNSLVQEVMEIVETRYSDHPGAVEDFALPVTRKQSLQLLDDFIKHRLTNFGDFQDAMWEGEFFLYHSRLSSAMNLKLLHPLEICKRAEEAYHDGSAPLNAVEGFIRQILGWREYIRGVYWHFDDDYRRKNFLRHTAPLPEFFWTGKTEMNCLKQTLKAVHRHSYSHHIQRLMITGLFCLLYGVDPQEFNDWHIATHCDAIDWVSTPNVIGMSQFADGGILASKPYCASGNYIHKMGNYCSNCRYNPKKATGDKACPFTTLYWDFLDRHQEKLADNHRMGFQFRNLKRKSAHDLDEIREQAETLRKSFN
ncbi:MAG: cryptochrome/photolyase family protein [Candidatus Eremiobacteraeota bacterium]|nr:cryptochrome/photolyase family protein [Candidatus Eremiobacteraeota bacterium]